MKNTSPLQVTMTADGSAVMELFTDIGSWGYQLKDFTAALSGIQSPDVTLRINSPGGEVIEALAIYDLIKASDKTFTCEVYGLCASAATLVALACGSVKMAANATWMVHEPSFNFGGTLAECDNLRETMSTLRDKVYAIYAAATGKTPEALAADHTSDRFYTAAEALEYGWISEILNLDDSNASEDPASVGEDTPADVPTEEPTDTEDDTTDDVPSTRPATALGKIRAALGLSTKEERLSASRDEWRRRALTAEAAARGAKSIAAVARAEAAAALQNVEARISAATAAAMAALAAPSDLPAPSEQLPERPKADLRAISVKSGVDAALDAVTALLDK